MPDIGLGVRLTTNGKIVERLTLKIKMFDNGKWEWTAQQRFIREPRIRLQDMLAILDELKTEIIASEETETEENNRKKQLTTTIQQQART